MIKVIISIFILRIIFELHCVYSKYERMNIIGNFIKVKLVKICLTTGLSTIFGPGLNTIDPWQL